MLRAELASIVSATVDSLITSGDLPPTARVAIEIIDTKDPAHGDFATNYALIASKPAGMNPRQIGEKLAAALSGSAMVDAAEVAGPGFVNLRLKPEAVAAYVPRVLEHREGLPSLMPAAERPTPLKINVEFVSVNPNGPITVGSGRGAAFGDTLSRVLEAAGHCVNREYYINDGVNSEQMRLFAESARYYVALRAFGEWERSQDVEQWDSSLLQVINAFAGTNRGLLTEPAEHVYDAWLLWAEVTSGEKSLSKENSMRVIENSKLPYYKQNRLRQLPLYLNAAWKTGKFEPPFHEFPEKGYKGDYVKDTAWMFVKTHDGDEEFFEEAEKHIFELDGLSWFQDQAQQWMIERQRGDLALFGVNFDTWFSEQSLHNSGVVDERIQELEDKGAADEEPVRIKVKFGKNGTIEEVAKEAQSVAAAEDDDDEDAELGMRNAESETDKTLWLRSTKFGDDMDRVLRRRDGRLTYIASDVAYHADKFNRPSNADKLITVLGPDHHGYIGRLHAVVGALLEHKPDTKDRSSNDTTLTEQEALIYGSIEERNACYAALEESRKRLEVVIFQIVRFVKDGAPAPMRKRDGNIYELRDLIMELGQAQAPNATLEEQTRIGADVSRFFYLMRSHDTHMDFDIDLAKKHSDENPVFYVQYAHARIAGVIRKAEEALGVGHSALGATGFDSSLLTHQREVALIKKILDLPEEVQRAAKDYGVHRLTTYSVELARSFHHFYDACRVVQADQPDLTKARLALCQAASIALKSALGLIGVSAPERMERAVMAEV